MSARDEDVDAHEPGSPDALGWLPRRARYALGALAGAGALIASLIATSGRKNRETRVRDTGEDIT